MNHQIPEGDVLVVAGDISSIGKKKDIVSFHEFLKQVPCKHKVVIAGNHDWCFENSKRKKAPLWLTGDDDSIHYLQDSEVIIDGIKFYGSPWQPEFYNWAFNLHRGKELKEKWNLIPQDTDVLVTHGPPAGILDFDRNWESVGCVDLLDRVLKIKPKVHVFGHLHLGYGTIQKEGIAFVNASVCDEIYDPIGKPIVIVI
jgi:Icc-related predicted phosphoesterase